MMSELPEDLLEEIFFHLPAPSLNRLRSTCKRWNLLFKDMRFTTKHFEKAPKQFQSLTDRFTVKGEAKLTEPRRADQIKNWQVSHCDGLLLCYTDPSRLVVWNPCTGQTKWIRPRSLHEICCATYALGSYQEKESNGNSYKILRNRILDLNKPDEFGIYEINSNSWRIIDVTIDFKLERLGVSLKGKTCWIGNRLKTDQSGTFKCIISFDYTTERFEPLCLLPYQSGFYETPFLSVVREEKLVVLLQHGFRDKAEIWVTNKISETKEVSWSKVLAFDFDRLLFRWEVESFVFDEEKKVLVFRSRNRVYIVGEDNDIVRGEDLGYLSSTPLLFDYVPSLIQLQQGIGEAKEERDE